MKRRSKEKQRRKRRQATNEDGHDDGMCQSERRGEVSDMTGKERRTSGDEGGTKKGSGSSRQRKMRKRRK